MGLKLPESRQSEAPQSKKRQVPIETIIKVMGNNPYAQAIDQIGPILSAAIQKRAELRKRGQELAALEKVAGQQEGAYAGLSNEMATSLASSSIKDTQQRQQNLPRIKLLEQQGGFAPGSLGDDFEAAKLIFTQNAIGGRQDKGLGDRSENQFKTRLNNQKSRMVNDPRIKPLYAQDIGLKQVGEIQNMVSKGNTVAAGALGVKMAKAMGEVGVLTDQDVARYVVSGRLDRMAADKLSRMIRGVPSNATQAEISQIASVLRDSFSEKVQPVYNEYIESFSEVEGLTPDEVSRKMAIPYRTLQPLPMPGQESPAQRKARLLQELQGAR